ncbi:ATP-binding protein [Streptomyces sp. 8N616]|uniref:ATP-binding protein n=1 Tax=Streptomyces sp. 8N616 TaxID=3457414 RepID=UPI003FCF29EC
MTQRFPRAASAVPEARSHVARTLEALGIADRADDVLVCVSELATNAIRHGDPHAGHFLLKVLTVDGRLRIEVQDTGRRRPRVQQPSPDETTGRGLLLVETLADGWGVEPRPPRGKVVWTEFKVEMQPEGIGVGPDPC